MPTVGGFNIGLSIAAGLAASRADLRIDPYQSCSFIVEIEGLLVGVRPQDPVTLATTVALLGGIALLASYLPARRATRIDPVAALRSE